MMSKLFLDEEYIQQVNKLFDYLKDEYKLTKIDIQEIKYKFNKMLSKKVSERGKQNEK